MRERLQQLVQDIQQHPALKNRFYEMWMDGTLDMESLEVFARNYGEFVKTFPGVLANLIAITEDTEARLEYVKTLYSEMGYGDSQRVHGTLLENFFLELGERLGQGLRLSWDRLVREVELLPTTRRLIDGELELYGNKDPRIAVGAQLAQEWQAYTMLSQLYEGARNYLRLWPNTDAFHEACEYFYAHIGAAEKEHKEEALRAATQYATDERNVEHITEGFDRLLNLFADFWQGIFDAVEAGAGAEQGRSVRA